MISRALASKIFEAFSISRWNDRVRPIELTEMDKHALKSILTYFIGKLEEKEGKHINWEYIVYGNIFALLKNIALSDIKAPIIAKIKENKQEYQKLNCWVVEQYKPYIQDQELLRKFKEFLIEDNQDNKFELQILKAAHKYSTKREFDIIKSFNNEIFPDIKKIELDLNDSIANFTVFSPNTITKVLNKSGDFNDLISIIDQLRCQTRWSQTPRIPKTSVLGHSMYVAILTFFLSREVKSCSNLLVNNFYTALFHDLPESVTRDIISPVKQATKNLPDLIKKIENEVCKRELYPKVPKIILNDLLYLMGDMQDDTIVNNDEFSNRIYYDNKPRIISDEVNFLDEYNKDRYNPIQGRLIKICDDIAAFMEAYRSIDYGISTHHLQDGLAYIRNKYNTTSLIQGIKVNEFFAEFI